LSSQVFGRIHNTAFKSWTNGGELDYFSLVGGGKLLLADGAHQGKKKVDNL
jgi:hypothetical protein